MFSYAFLKETKGNSEMENRLLYSSADVRQQRLLLQDGKGKEEETRVN